MNPFRREANRLSLLCRAAAGAIAILLLGNTSARCAITVTADPFYPDFPDVFTTDPSAVNNGNRGITADRNLRQTFKNPTTIDIGHIVLSFDVNAAAGGMVIDFYEVDDVLGVLPSSGGHLHREQPPGRSKPDGQSAEG